MLDANLVIGQHAQLLKAMGAAAAAASDRTLSGCCLE
jgi:hypothetical protein